MAIQNYKAQWRFWSDCSELNLCWDHMAKGTSSDIAAHLGTCYLVIRRPLKFCEFQENWCNFRGSNCVKNVWPPFLNKVYSKRKDFVPLCVINVFLLLTLVLLNPDRSCFWKQCRSRSVGFWRSQLIWIFTVYHTVCEFISTFWIK